MTNKLLKSKATTENKYNRLFSNRNKIQAVEK